MGEIIKMEIDKIYGIGIALMIIVFITNALWIYAYAQGF